MGSHCWLVPSVADSVAGNWEQLYEVLHAANREGCRSGEQGEKELFHSISTGYGKSRKLILFLSAVVPRRINPSRGCFPRRLPLCLPTPLFFFSS